MRLKSCILLLLFLSTAIRAAAGEAPGAVPGMTRVAVAAAGDGPVSIKGYLLCQFRQEPRIRLVDPFRTDLVLKSVMSPACDVKGDLLLRRVAVFADALIYVADAGTNICVSVLAGSGEKTTQFPAAYVRTAPGSAFENAAGFVRAALGLPPTGGYPEPDMAGLSKAPTILAAYYHILGFPPFLDLTRDRLLRHASRPMAFIDAFASDAWLERVWADHRHSAALAARKLYNLHLASLGQNVDFRRKLIEGREAITAVLGTDYEQVAYPLLGGALGKEFEEILRQTCGPLLPLQDSDFDALAENGSAEALGVPVMPGNTGGRSASPAVRNGALRCLGCIQTPSALKLVLGPAGNGDPAVREAVACGLAWQSGETARASLRRLAGDSSQAVALAAMVGLWRQGSADPRLLPALRKAPDLLFQTAPPAAEALGALAGADDRDRLRAFGNKLSGTSRLAMIRARLRLGDVDDVDAVRLLRDDDPDVVVEALKYWTGRKIGETAANIIRQLANDTDRAIADEAGAILMAQAPADPAARLLLRLECGSPYDRLSVLAGAMAKRDIIPAAELLERGISNQFPLVRFESLRLAAEHYPGRAPDMIRAGLADPHRWVRMLAAATAAEKSLPELAGAIREALAREASDTVRLALQAALAKADGTPPPPRRAPANPAGDATRLVWTDLATDKDLDYTPIRGYLCKFSAAGIIERGNHVYKRTLWGQLPGPESLTCAPDAFDKFWSDLDSVLRDDFASKIDGCDLRLMGFGRDWDGGWRDFCSDAGIDPGRIGGSVSNLNVYERHAFENWTLERGISGFNLLYDLIRLQNRFRRPNLQVATWSMPAFTSGSAASLARWKCDLNWTISPSSYLAARMFKTLWPDRPYVYRTPLPGGVPVSYLRYDSPVPEAFIFESTNRVFSHTLMAWLAGAHLEICAGWRFVDYKTPQEGDVPGPYMAFNSIGPDPGALDQAIEYAFKDAPISGKKPALSVDILASDPGDETGLLLDKAPDDPAASRKKTMRTGMRLMQKHLYDCARIFASLPRHVDKPQTLLIGGTPNIGAAFELANLYDFLPGVNLAAGRDLSGYRLVIVHNPPSLRDEAIRALSAWLKEMPGLLVIHQDLTADNTAEAGTPADHDGILREDWPWEKDLVIHPAGSAGGVSLGALDVTAEAGTMKVTADTNRSYAACLTPKAVALARAGDKVVLARWRDPAYRGAVLFDGLRAPSKEYVALLAAEINALAQQGIGRSVTGRPVMLETETEQFQVAVSPGYGEAIQKTLRLSGIDLMSGVVDPVVGPEAMGAAIVPRKDYFHRYLACTARIVALGDREFSKAGKAEGGGLLLQNAGIIQLAGRTPLKVSRQNGQPLPAIPFDYDWVFDGAKEGMAVYKTDAGVQLTFVRCADPVVVRPD